MSDDIVSQFNDWLEDEGDVAALVMREWLESVEGKDAVIFPPTYAKPERRKDEDWLGYNIDRFDDGSSVCQIDSVGSQANRIEPIFKEEKYKHLVPQVVIKVNTANGEKRIHLLEAGHRAADAIARFADKVDGDGADGKALAELLWDAFKAWQDRGDAEPLARIAPTSIIFGAWDSRATQAKLARIVRSVIRAYNVKPCTRSAQYNTPLHYVDDGLIDESLDKGEGERNPLSQEGFRHNPAPAAHGGVIVLGDIQRDVSLNLVALRAISAAQRTGERPEQYKERVMKLRRYILGLALVAVTARNGQQLNLREGCLLRISRPPAWKVVPFQGMVTELEISPTDAFAFADSAARDFDVQQFGGPFVFDSRKAEKWLSLTKDERDKRRRKAPVIKQDL